MCGAVIAAPGAMGATSGVFCWYKMAASCRAQARMGAANPRLCPWSLHISRHRTVFGYFGPSPVICSFPIDSVARGGPNPTSFERGRT